MNTKLDLQWFIEQHNNWEMLLKAEPYCLEIKRDKMFNHNLVLFKYNMIGSDFSLNIVKECRGIVLDEDTNEVAVFPFTKFFNSHEVYADKIDWNTAVVSQKLDGSIIKIVRIGDELLIGTNSNIDAFKAQITEQLNCTAKTFGDLVIEGIKYYGLSVKEFTDLLEHDKTYIFELTSPYNQVVVKFNETKINLIGIRDNITFQEEKFELSPLAKIFNTPKIYNLNSEDDCIKAAAELPDSEEGYVVRDDDFRRIKIKSPRYLELHRLAGNHVLSFERAVEIVKANEISEVVSYFPDFEKSLNEVKDKYNDLITQLETEWEGFMINVTTAAPRKEAAVWIMKNFTAPGCGFAMLDQKVKTVKEWLDNCPTKNLVKMLGFKE